MSIRKGLASLAVLAFASSVMLSSPAIAQSADNDDDVSLWLAGFGLTGTAVLALLLGTSGNDNEEENPPLSP